MIGWRRDKGLRYLVRFPMEAYRTKTRGDAWRRVAVTYVLMQEDYTVPRVY